MLGFFGLFRIVFSSTGIDFFTIMEYPSFDLSHLFIELHARGDGKSSPEIEMIILKPTRRCPLKHSLLRQHHAEPYAPGEMIERERQTGMSSCSQPDQLQKSKVPLTTDEYCVTPPIDIGVVARRCFRSRGWCI